MAGDSAVVEHVPAADEVGGLDIGERERFQPGVEVRYDRHRHRGLLT